LTNIPVAIKIVHTLAYPDYGKNFIKMLPDIQRLKNQNIVRIYNYQKLNEDNEYQVVMELCNIGNLQDYVL
jgi:serine/threonine protein kinase